VASSRLEIAADDDAARAKFEKAYGVEIDGKPGLDNIEMLHAIEEGVLERKISCTTKKSRLDKMS
jgi:predicted molibdopterin-dependent oxidoreductase YjgC